MAPPSYKVFVSPVGNVFMAEIASMLADSIEATGREVERCADELPEAESAVINLVVAPHEFFMLRDRAPESDLVRAASQSICVGVEQPGTPWFEEGVRYASYGPMVLDINKRGVRELRRRGLEAHHLQLGYHQGWDAWDGQTDKDRSVDAVFLGAKTPRRSKFLAHSAQVLSEWNCDIRLFEPDRPVQTGSGHFAAGRDKYRFLADSRVLLNVHQGDRDYFEWVRVIEAISNGCLVVTESSGGYAPLVPTEHFVHGPYDSLIGRLDAFLRDEDLRTETAQRAYDFIRKSLVFVDIIDQALEALERHAGFGTARAGLPHSVLTLPAAVQRKGPRRPVRGLADASRRGAHSATLDGERRMRSMIQHLLLAEIDNIRSIEAVMSAVDHGVRVRVDTFDTPAYASADPEVSVVIPLFNYGSFIRQTIESVVASEGVAVELVVVDDHSTDDSVHNVRQAFVDFEDFPIRLVTQSANQGLSTTRNLGFEQARAEYVFLLDADNAVFPRGIRRLASALEESDAAFSYGIIEMFGETSDLVSCLPWDVRRLTLDNYIDAMALIRKSVWAMLGGFDSQTDRMGGWEDYDFWLHVAAEGQRGQLVTQFVGRYRSHGESMLSTVNLETGALTDFLRRKYPALPWAE
jgi:hypothetical protein